MKKGDLFRFISTDCAGMYVPGPDRSGAIVTYVKPAESKMKDCHIVRCPLGDEFRAFSDELQPLKQKLVENEAFDPHFIVGDKVVCLDATASHLDGECHTNTLELFKVYQVRHVIGNGRIIAINTPQLSLWLARRFELVERNVANS